MASFWIFAYASIYFYDEIFWNKGFDLNVNKRMFENSFIFGIKFTYQSW